MTRTFHLIDIENLVDQALPDDQAICQTIHTYRHRIGIGPADLVVIGTNMSPLYRLTVALAWPGCRVVAGRGPGGAGQALLAAVDPTWLIRRGFHRVVVGSGDRCFAMFAARLKRAGLTVEVVGRSHEIHWSLWPASHLVLNLADSVPVPGGAPHAPIALATAA